MSDEGNTMEPFTPTTEQVRAAYVRASRQAFIAATSEHEAEFDRWLAATVAVRMQEGVTERNRRAIEEARNGLTIQESVHARATAREWVSASFWLD